jgi:hypothetical protein
MLEVTDIRKIWFSFTWELRGTHDDSAAESGRGEAEGEDDGVFHVDGLGDGV